MLNIDREHIWHPYGNPMDPAPVSMVKSCRGTTIELEDGTKLIDAISSWWCVAHGHNNPKIMAAMSEQLEKFSHVMFAGFTHEAAIELTKRLLKMLPANLSRVFYSDSGSVAVEVALKMALQYQFAIGEVQRKRIMTIRSGYHGDTIGTMALGDPDGMHKYFSSMLPKALFIDTPEIGFDEVWQESTLDNAKEMFARHGSEVAALIIEPIFQGGGGMRLYHPNYLTELRQLCDQYNVLLICDEIATGFGRTGKLFACEHGGVVPDIICLGKAITGGAITLAATATTEKVARGIGESETGRLMHGPTFMANAVACAAASASLDIFASGLWQEQVPRIEAQLKRELAVARDFENVQEVRVVGAIGIIELKEGVTPNDILPLLLEEGVWLRPHGNALYTMPPFIIEEDELTTVTSAMLRIAKESSIYIKGQDRDEQSNIF